MVARSNQPRKRACGLVFKGGGGGVGHAEVGYQHGRDLPGVVSTYKNKRKDIVSVPGTSTRPVDDKDLLVESKRNGEGLNPPRSPRNVSKTNRERLNPPRFCPNTSKTNEDGNPSPNVSKSNRER